MHIFGESHSTIKSDATVCKILLGEACIHTGFKQMLRPFVSCPGGHRGVPVYIHNQTVIVSSSLKFRRHHSTPPDKEGKKLDACGRCLYSTGTLGIKSCNYIACMSRYIHAIFEDLLPILQLVSNDMKQHTLQLCTDGMTATRQNIPWKHT